MDFLIKCFIIKISIDFFFLILDILLKYLELFIICYAINPADLLTIDLRECS